jgi:hypothetical protein
MLDISSIVKYNSFMMNFDIFPAIQCKKQRKPLINNMLRHSFPRVDFTRSENSKSSTRLNNLWGESTGVSSLLSEGIKNTEQPDRQITFSFNKNSAQRYKRCVNISEPAAVSWISIHEKVVDDHKTLASAAGSLFLATDLHMTDTYMVGWNEIAWMNGCVVKWLLGIFLIVNCQLGGLKLRSLVIGEKLEERSLVIGHWSLGGGFEAIILNGCVIAWLLGNFLIVNCQLECLEVRSLVIGEKLEERSLVIGKLLEVRSLVICHWSLAEFGEERSLVISERG